MSFIMVVQPALAGTQGLLIKVPMGLAKSPAGDLSVTPNPGRFPDGVAVASPSAPLTLTVTNSGFSSIQNVVVGVPGNSDEFSHTSTCGSTLVGKSSCTISVTFKPTAAGERSGTVAVSSTASNGLQLVPVSGLGVVPSAALAIRAFPATQVNETSTALATLTNSSTVALKLGPVNPASPFSLDAGGSCGSNLEAGGSCSYKIKYAPLATGASTGSFKVGLAVGSFSFERSVPLAATAQAPSATLSIGVFGNVAAGASKDVTGTLTNTGVGALSVSAPSVSGAGFSVAGMDCPASLAAGDSCGVTVRLTAAGQTAHTGVLSVPTLAGTKTAALSGQAQQAVLDFQPTSIDFGTKQTNASYQQSATLRNTGNLATGALTLAAPTGYNVSGSSCTAGLAAGGSCSVTVTFSPSSAQSYSGKLSATAANTSAQLNVSGAAQNASATLDALDFGNVAAGSNPTMDATLTNTGLGPLSITVPAAASVTGSGFSFVGTTCSSSLPAGSSCAVKVLYTPSGTAASSGSLSVSTGAGTKTSSLNGQSLQAILTLSYPGHVLGVHTPNYGSVYVGETSGSSTYTLTNTGNTSVSSVVLSVSTGWTISGSNCGSTFGAGASCTFTVPFTPSAAKTYNGSLSVSGASAVNSGAYSLTGVGLARYSQATLTSANSQVLASWYGDGQKSVAFTYRNDGNQTMTLNSPSLSAPLQVIGNSCSGIAAGSSCAISVALNSTAAGAGGSSSQTFSPSGATTGPSAASASWTIYSAIPQWSSSSLAFGSILAGQSSTQNITLYNFGSAAYNWAWNNSIANLPSGFSFDTSACSNVAPSGGSCTVRVTFAPSAGGSYGGGSIYPAASSFVNNYLSVSGTGVTPTPLLSLNNSSAGFGTVSTSGPWSSGIYTVTNSGTAAATGVSVSAPANFGLASNTCSSTLAVGSSCSFVITATPPSPGTYSGNTTVSSTNGGTLNIATSITLSAKVALSVSPTSAVFGSVTVGGSSSASSHTLSATGNTTATGISISPPSGYSIVSSTCGSTLAAGSSCSFGVRFSPSAAQAYNGNLSISSSNGGSLSVSTSGTGVAAPSVTSASFGPTTVTAGSASTFSWSTSNATAAGVSCNWGSLSSSGTSGSLSTPTSGPGSGTCTVTATNAAGSTATGSATLTAVAAPTVSSTVDASTITVGGTTLFRWSTTGATSVSSSCGGAASGDSYSGASVNDAVYVRGSAAGTATCSVTAYNSVGASASSSKTVSVVAASTPGAFGSYYRGTVSGSPGSPNHVFYIDVQNSGTGTITGITATPVSGVVQSGPTSLAPGATGRWTAICYWEGCYASTNWTFTGTNASNSPWTVR